MAIRGHPVAGEEMDNRPKLGTYVTVMNRACSSLCQKSRTRWVRQPFSNWTYPRRYALMSAAPSNDSSGRDGT